MTFWGEEGSLIIVFFIFCLSLSLPLLVVQYDVGEPYGFRGHVQLGHPSVFRGVPCELIVLPLLKKESKSEIIIIPKTFRLFYLGYFLPLIIFDIFYILIIIVLFVVKNSLQQTITDSQIYALPWRRQFFPSFCSCISVHRSRSK